MKFDEWMRGKSLSEATIKNYYSAVEGSLSLWARESGLIQGSLFEIKGAQMDDIARRIKDIPMFEERDRVGHGMYAAALVKYMDFLRETDKFENTTEDAENDIRVIIEAADTTDTEKIRLVNARVGQGKYREELIKLWRECAVTGYSEPALLLASHIKPWAISTPSERLDKFNGLLLIPNLDRAFDKGLISFAVSGRIMISSLLRDTSLFGINAEMSIKPMSEHEQYMKFHRENVFVSK